MQGMARPLALVGLVALVVPALGPVAAPGAPLHGPLDDAATLAAWVQAEGPPQEAFIRAFEDGVFTHRVVGWEEIHAGLLVRERLSAPGPAAAGPATFPRAGAGSSHLEPLVPWADCANVRVTLRAYAILYIPPHLMGAHALPGVPTGVLGDGTFCPGWGEATHWADIVLNGTFDPKELALWTRVEAQQRVGGTGPLVLDAFPYARIHGEGRYFEYGVCWYGCDVESVFEGNGAVVEIQAQPPLLVPEDVWWLLP